MPTVDIDELLAPVSEDEPCGEDLYDLTDSHVLDSMVQGREETQFAEAEEPDWPAVLEKSRDLLGQGKHLQVAVWLTHALAERQGMQGLRDGLNLIHGLLVRCWDSLYPELDEDDDNPALERMNILLDIGSETGGFMRSVKKIPIADSRRLGKFCWRDVQIAKGEIPPREDGEATDMALISGAIRETDTDQIAETVEAIREAVATIGQIRDFLDGNLGNNNTCRIERLGELLQSVVNEIDSILSLDALPDGAQGGEEGGEQGAAAGGGGAAKPQQGISGEIRSHGDILKLFDKICTWYSQNEPSSPVPYVINRARKLVGRNFKEIIAEIADEAESQVEKLFGREEEDDD